MGFFDGVANAIDNLNPITWASDAIKAASGGAENLDAINPTKWLRNQANGLNSQGPQTDPAAIDPRLAQIRDQQQAEAKQFRDAMPDYEKQLGDSAESQSRRQLAQTMAGVRSGYNSRGLLYSGSRQSGEIGAQADATSQLAQQREQIHQGLSSAADDYDKQALQSSLDVNQMESNIQDQLYQRALSNMANNNSALTGFLGAGGTATGAALAKGSK